VEQKTVTIKFDEGLATVTIDNPPVNSITPKVIDDLDEAFTVLAAREDLRCVVLASRLEKIFVAGADINQFISWKKADGIATTRRGHDVFLKIENLFKPVVCAINGVAFGGGLELALACDIRVVDAKAKIGLPETGLGIIPGYGGTQRLPRLVGAGMAKKLVLSGAPISGEEAYRIGIAEMLSASGECLRDATALAQQIGGQAPMAVTAGKQSIAYAASHTLEEGIDFEIERVGALADSEDKTEGANAFLEKRTAVFRNK
jgi:enoyl-CoA hydratase/carnithine racemase